MISTNYLTKLNVLTKVAFAARHYFTLLFLLVAAMASHAGGTKEQVSQASAGNLLFTENKGQWTDAVSYRADVPGGTVFLEKNGFTYALVNAEDVNGIHPPKKEIPDGGQVIRMHALKVQFLNTSGTASLTGSNTDQSYSNYFVGNDPAKWASNVKSFKAISYNKLYDGVDMKVYSLYNSLKYDLIVAPHASASRIKLEYSGADNMSIENGDLKIATTAGLVTEMKPYAYQVIKGKVIPVACRYSLDVNVLSFVFPTGYNADYELIIDPNLIFSTLTGSIGDNWGFTATYDDQGNFYTGGVTLATGYPITSGAYQTVWRGGGAGGGNGYPFEVSLTKYNPAGTARIFSTYLGGTDNEFPSSLIVNKNGELYVLGRTYSVNFPVTNGAYRTFISGGGDLFVTHFNAAGSSLLGSTYIGGSSDDGVNISAIFTTMSTLKYNYGDDFRSDIFVDTNDVVYVASCSRSSNFPTANAFQTTLNGQQDGVVFKMNGNLTTLLWSSYIGGSGVDGAYAVTLDNTGNVLITGGTNSPNFPITAGTYQTAFSGTIDGFIAKIPNAGGSILRSTYIGTTSYDQSYLIQSDPNNNIYVAGQTHGLYPVSPGVYSNPNSSQFIHKFDSTLTTSVFSTVIGNGNRTAANMSLTAFLVDICGNLYLSGWGRSCLPLGSYPSGNVTGMPITANAFQQTTNGCNFYFIELSRDAKGLLYGSYFGDIVNGQEHVDGGTSRFDKNGVIYQSVCAACGGYTTGFPTTAGVVSTTNNSTNCNNGSIKMKFDNNFVIAGYTTPNGNTGCVPATISFSNSSLLGGTYSWDFGDGNNSTATSPTHLYNIPGTYSITLIANNQTTCNLSDTTHGTVIIFPPATVSAGPDATICNGASTSLTATGGTGYTYIWTPSTGLNNPNIANPVANPTITTIYVVNATDVNGCTASDSITITVGSLIATASQSTSICNGGSTQLSSSGGTVYSWIPASGLDNTTISNPNANPTTTTTYTVTVSNASGCSGTATVTVTVNQLPTVTFTSIPGVCINAAAFTLTSGSPSGGVYSGTGVTGNTFNPSVAGVGTHTLTYNYTDVNGCSGSATTTATVNALPNVTFAPLASVCANASAVTLTGGSPSGGTYSGPGVTGNTFDPSVAGTGTHTLTYNYTDANGCSGSATTTISVNVLPNVTFAPLSGICANTSAITLTGGSPSGGTYSGPGVTGNSFDPSVAGTGTHTLIYNYTDPNGCSGSAATTITVNALPNVTFAPMTNVCVNATAFTLTGGSPSGGTYGGTGVTGNTFNPPVAGIGTHTLTYNYTDVNGCSGSATSSITVDPAGTVTINSVPDMCVSASPVTLSGSPAGGTFSGPGVTGNTFDPALAGAGTHTITYTFTSSPCLNNTSALTSVVVSPQPSAAIVPSPPNGCANNYYGNAVLTAIAGPITSYQWYMNGVAISGATSSTYIATQTGWYNVIVTLNGCVSDSTNKGINIALFDVKCGHDTTKKVVICHVPDCRHDKEVTICIGQPAVPAHFKNHPCDCMGPCPNPHPNKRDADIDYSGIEFSVVPNPFSKEGVIEFYISDPAHTTIEIYDIKGMLIGEYFDRMAEGDVHYRVNVSGLAEGIYIAKLRSGDFLKHLKMVVTR